MAVKKIHRLVINCVYLCIGLSGVTAKETAYAGERSQHFVDQTIRMDGAISSVTPHLDGRYFLEINKEAIFTCIPFTTSEPRMRTVSVSLQNRGRHLRGCDCLLQWKPHTGQYQCFCSIPWTFRRYGEESVKCCIDDSYHDSCHHGYVFHINVFEMTSTMQIITTETVAESTDATTLLSTFFADEKSTQLNTITFLPSSDKHYTTTSIPTFQTDSHSFHNSNAGRSGRGLPFQGGLRHDRGMKQIFPVRYIYPEHGSILGREGCPDHSVSNTVAVKQVRLVWLGKCWNAQYMNVCSGPQRKGISLVTHWLPVAVGVALIGVSVAVISVRIWIKRTSQNGNLPRGTPV